MNNYQVTLNKVWVYCSLVGLYVKALLRTTPFSRRIAFKFPIFVSNVFFFQRNSSKK